MRFRVWLLRLVLVAALPLLLLAVAVAAWTALQQRQSVLAAVANTAQALQLAIDRELVSAIGMLEAVSVSLATDAALDGEAARLHANAVRIVERSRGGVLNIVLYAADGRQMMNSSAPPGTPLPAIDDVTVPEGATRVTNARATLAEIMAQGRPHVSDLFRGPLLKRHIIAVSVPVIRDGMAEGVLTTSIDPARLSGMLRDQNLPAGWIASVMDRNILLIARNKEADRFLAQPVTGVEAMTPTGVPEVYRAVSLTGVPVYAAMARSSLASWRLGLLVPRAAVEAPMWRALALIGLGGAAIVGLGVWTALAMGRRMGREVEMLAASAADGRARPDAETPHVRIAEVEAVRAALDRAGAALRSSEAQFRTLAETVPDLLFVTDRRGAVTYVNPAFASYAGLPAGRLLDDGWQALLAEEERAPVLAQWTRSLRAQTPHMAEFRLRRHDGAWRSFLCRAVPQRDERGKVAGWVGTCTDIQHVRDSRERLQVLLREVDHRAKNALAVVQSILRLTPANDPAAYARAVEGRIAAMASAHSLLSASQWSGARLEDLIARELAPFRGAVTLEPPPAALAVEPESTQAVAMVLHELATNAAKHGALSTPGGRVRIGWTMLDGPARLSLNWEEEGGPPLDRPPAQSGFGTLLMRQIVETQLRGGLSFRWDAGGLRCAIELPPDCFVAGGVLDAAAARAPAPVDAQGDAPGGRLILIVEDEAITALAMAKVLREAGYRPLGPVGRVDDALDLLRTARPDAAVLDLNLFGRSSQPVAEALRDMRVPFVICSGYGEGGPTLAAANDAPRLAKPVSGERLVGAVAQVMRAGG